MISARARFPAYGRRLVHLRKMGIVPNNPGVVIVDDWKRWQRYLWRAVVEPNAVPGALDFSFAAGLEVIVIAATPERVDEIGAAVATFSPYRLIGVSINPPRILPFVAPAST